MVPQRFRRNLYPAIAEGCRERDPHALLAHNFLSAASVIGFLKNQNPDKNPWDSVLPGSRAQVAQKFEEEAYAALITSFAELQRLQEVSQIKISKIPYLERICHSFAGSNFFKRSDLTGAQLAGPILKLSHSYLAEQSMGKTSQQLERLFSGGDVKLDEIVVLKKPGWLRNFEQFVSTPPSIHRPDYFNQIKSGLDAKNERALLAHQLFVAVDLYNLTTSLFRGDELIKKMSPDVEEYRAVDRIRQDSIQRLTELMPQLQQLWQSESETLSNDLYLGSIVNSLNASSNVLKKSFDQNRSLEIFAGSLKRSASRYRAEEAAQIELQNPIILMRDLSRYAAENKPQKERVVSSESALNGFHRIEQTRESKPKSFIVSEKTTVTIPDIPSAERQETFSTIKVGVESGEVNAQLAHDLLLAASVYRYLQNFFKINYNFENIDPNLPELKQLRSLGQSAASNLSELFMQVAALRGSDESALNNDPYLGRISETFNHKSSLFVDPGLVVADQVAGRLENMAKGYLRTDLAAQSYSEIMLGITAVSEFDSSVKIARFNGRFRKESKKPKEIKPKKILSLSQEREVRQQQRAHFKKVKTIEDEQALQESEKSFSTMTLAERYAYQAQFVKVEPAPIDEIEERSYLKMSYDQRVRYERAHGQNMLRAGAGEVETDALPERNFSQMTYEEVRADQIRNASNLRQRITDWEGSKDDGDDNVEFRRSTERMTPEELFMDQKKYHNEVRAKRRAATRQANLPVPQLS